MWRELQPDDPGRIGPYRLRGVLGVGGMGRVFLGASVDGDQVAVKVIRADLAMDPEFRARFRREVTVTRKVSSRFAAPLIGADADGPVPWLATVYVTGPSLADAVAQRGPLPAASVLELAAGLAEGVSAIHSAGVIHRDLKPSKRAASPGWTAGHRLRHFRRSRDQPADPDRSAHRFTRLHVPGTARRPRGGARQRHLQPGCRACLRRDGRSAIR
jgi:hypothetical protein